MTNRRDFLQTTIGAAIMGSTAFQQAWAQSGLPIEQVKVLYGFPPGSSGDICARRVAEKFLGTLGDHGCGVPRQQSIDNPTREGTLCSPSVSEVANKP